MKWAENYAFLKTTGGTVSGPLTVASLTVTGGATLDGATATTPATLDNSTNVATTAFVKAQGYQIGNQTITLSGDIGGSGTTAITTTLPTVNANVGTFQGITVNAKGQVTAAVNQNYVTGGPYLPLSGGTLTGGLTGTTGSFSGNLSGGNLGTGGSLTVTGGASIGGSVNTGPLSASSLGSVGGLTVSGTSGLSTVNTGQVAPVTNDAYWCGLPTGSGNAWYGVAAYSFPVQSDARGKTNIAVLPDACLDLVAAITPKRYEHKDGPAEDKGRVHWGFIAQEVGAVMAAAGHDFSGGNMVHDGWHSLDYGQMTAILWQAVRELAAEVAALKKEGIR